MLYYVRSGEVDVRQNADTPKLAALAVIKGTDKYLGTTLFVGTKEIGTAPHDESMFLTKTLINELGRTFHEVPNQDGGFIVVDA